MCIRDRLKQLQLLHEATVTALAEKDATAKDAIKKTLSNFDICFLLFLFINLKIIYVDIYAPNNMLKN